MRTTLIRLVFCSIPLFAAFGCSGADPAETGDEGEQAERGPIGKADSNGQCVTESANYCGGKSKGNCWCDTTCAQYGDCCEDAATACGTGTSPQINFDSDWSEDVEGTLTRGATVKIDYDDKRLSKCRGEQGGYKQWAITGYYRIDGGTAKSFTVAGANAPSGLPSITLDKRGDLEIWFQNTNRWGCNEWDSNMGDNYHFEVK